MSWTRLLIILIGSLCHTTQAQQHEVRFDHLGIEHGLSQYSVLCMLQDQRGFLWIGTQDGLNRYDGYTFKTYRHDPADSTSLVDDHISALHEDSTGILWIGTRTGWLVKFDHTSGRFMHYSMNALLRNTTTPIYDIAEGGSGELWLATDTGLVRFDPQTEQFVRYSHDPLSSASINHNAVRAVAGKQDGNFWVGTLSGLDAFNPTTGQFTRVLSDVDSIRALHVSRDGTLWLGTLGAGLVRYHPATGQRVGYRHRRNDSYSLSNNIIYALHEDRQGQIWIGTNGGVNILDSASGQFVRHVHDPADANSLSNNEVHSIFEDRSGVLWVGTWSGLNKLSPFSRAITHHGYQADGKGLSAPRVVAIYEDQAGILWIGTLGGGLNRIDRTTGQISYYTSTPGDTTSLSSNDVVSIFEDSKGRLWVGTLGGGLHRLDRKLGRFLRYQHRTAAPASLSSNNVISIYEDHTGVLWIGTVGGGLNRFDPDAGTFEQYRHHPDDPFSLGNDYAWAIYEDRAKRLWIGTIDGGLNWLDVSSGQFTRYYHDAEDSTSLSSNRIYCLLEDAAGTLWVGTTEGLNRLDEARVQFKAYREKDGLPHNHVVGMLLDQTGHLWLSTNNGLSRFNPITEQFVNYSSQDGLHSEVFHVGASYKSRTGELLFGGADGVYIINPRQLEASLHPPPVVLTDFRVFDQPFLSNQPIDALQEVHLKYNEHFFSLAYAALDFAAPEQNRYSYMLEGFDETWSPPSPHHEIRYTNVPPGTYTFRIQAANRDGAWNEAGIILPITIAPPFWQTWPFRLLVLFLVFLVLFVAYKYRVRQLLRVERMRMRIAGNLHDDIGANLSSIAIKTDMALALGELNERQSRQLSEISRMARETAYKLREIVWVVNADYDTLDKLLTKLEDTTSSMLDGCLSCTFLRPDQALPQRLSMDFRQNLFFLYKEVLNNIIKHAQATHVDINISLRRSTLVVQVKDNGIGFTEGLIRPGNGLRLMRRRAAHLHGQLEIQSNAHEGTQIILTAPLE